jgi:hypothetical protein
MVFEELAQGLLLFVNYGITILVIMLIWEVFKFFTGPKDADAVDKLKEPFGRIAKEGLGADLKLTGRRIKQLFTGEEATKKLVLGEYADLENLKDMVDKSTNDGELQSTAGSSFAKVGRREKRAYQRVDKLKDEVEKTYLSTAKKDKAEAIAKEMEISNNTVLAKMREFDETLRGNQKFPAKKKKLLKTIEEAIDADRALTLELQNLNKLMK